MGNIIKRALAFLIAVVALSISFCVFAEVEEKNIYTNTSNIYLSGRTDDYDTNNTVTVLMRKKGEIKYINDFPLNSDGSYEFKFKFHYDGSINDYTFTLNAGGNDITQSCITATATDDVISYDLAITDNGLEFINSEAINAVIKIKNKYADDNNFIMATAIYDEKGRLISVDTNNVALDFDLNQRLEFSKNISSAFRAKVFLLDSVSKIRPLTEAEEVKTQSYASDSFINANGTLKTNANGDYNIVFIGGSLTAGDSTYEIDGAIEDKSKWANVVTNDFFLKNYPDANFHLYNVAQGGTTSEMAVKRFYNHVIEKEPDVVFIEFAVNDAYLTKDGDTFSNAEATMENLVRRLSRLKKQPVIIITVCPRPFDMYTEEAIVRAKYAKVAEKYGIGVADINSYFSEITNGYTDMTALYQYYDVKAKNVHPLAIGYEKFGDIVTNELTKNPLKYFRHSNGLQEALYTNSANSDYRLIYMNDPRIKVSGKWNYVLPNEGYKDNLDVARDITHGTSWLYGKGGLYQSYSGGDEMTITTASEEISVFYMNPNELYTNNSVSYYIDGIKKEKIDKKNDYKGNFGMVTINLPSDGNEHKIRFVTDEPVNYTSPDGNVYNRHVFNIIYIAEKK